MAALGMVLARHYRSALGSKCLGQSICYRLQRSCGKVMFSQMCVKNYVHRGVCAWGGAYMVGRGVVYGKGACMAGGVVCMAGGACVAGGCV